MPQSNELRIFISSTFQDLHEEREHLVKKIFPEIRSLCRERGITFTEVDLRWGLTEDEGTYGQIVRTCLEQVDRCRPYFIGIAGDRYGYIPPYVEIQKDPDLLQQFPWVEDAVLDGASITDMEVRHGVLDDPESAPHARFYFRRHRASLDEADESEESRLLDDLKQRIQNTDAVVHEFRDPVSLGELVYDDLIEIIKRDFADARPPTPLETERARHTAFAASRRRAYIANPEYLQRLNKWFASDEPPLVIYAESGSGKSSLVSFWADRLRRKHPDLFVVEHYVGIGAGDRDHLGLIKHIMEEIKERFNREEDLPEKPEDIERGLGQWLGYAVHGLKQENARMLLILDGLNQLGEKAQNLLWIPDVIDPEIRLVLTSTVEETLVKLRSRKWSEMGMQPLSESEREAVVVRYLSEYHKKLPAEQVRRIAGDVKCAHPLFLRTLLEELRVFGHHDHLEREVDRLLRSTGTEDLFQHVLERIEGDFNARSVGHVMRLLWASRSGLTEGELAAMTGISRLKLTTMLLGLDYHLVRTNGQLSFFHDYLRRAVAKRYLGDDFTRKEAWGELAAYFGKAEPDLRGTRELVHALEMSGDGERLESVLAEIPRFLLLWNEGSQEDVLQLWAASDPDRVAEAYRSGLERWEEASPHESDLITALGDVSALLERIGAWSAAQAVALRWRESATRVGDRAGVSEALSRVAGLFHLQGRIEEAEDFAREAESEARGAGNQAVLARAIGNQGTRHLSRGEYDEALACYAEQERIVRELGDRHNIARAIGNRGVVHMNRGEYEEALACYAEQERISRELGARVHIAHAAGNRGVVHMKRGEYEEALTCYAEQERINRELGDRHNIAMAIGNRGIVHHKRGEYEEALSCFAEQERILRELGDRRGIARAIGNRGVVHMNRSEYEEALTCYAETEQILRELGDRRGTAIAAGNQGSVHLYRGEYEEALSCFAEQERIVRELGDRGGMAVAIGNRGLVHKERGEYEEALACYAEHERIDRELGNRAGAARAIGNRSSLHEARGEFEEALTGFLEAEHEVRDLGQRYPLRYWMSGVASTLVGILETVEELPDYLHAFLTAETSASGDQDLSTDDWRRRAREAARRRAEEVVTISDELSTRDTRFEGRVILARITAAAGDVPSAVSTLQDLLNEWTEPEEQAEIHYRIWKLHCGQIEEIDSDVDAVELHRQTSRDLYVELYRGTPTIEYKNRIDELGG